MANFPGTPGDDEIEGTNGNDTISGQAGDDLIDAQGGVDTIFAGSGDDAVFGGAGDDLIGGDAGFDLLLGGTGADSVNGGADDDIVADNDIFIDNFGVAHAIADTSSDTLNGDAGSDILFGGTQDSFDGGAGEDAALLNFTAVSGVTVDLRPLDTGGSGSLPGSGTIRNVEAIAVEFGGGGNSAYGSNFYEEFYGGSGNDIFDGGGGDDLLVGNDGADLILGGAGLDYIDGGAGNDNLSGGDGDDDLFSGAGVDRIDGGAGVDVVEFDRSTSNANFVMSSSLIASDMGSPLADGSAILNVEIFGLRLGSGADMFTLDTPLIGANLLDFGGGSDRFIGNFAASATAITLLNTGAFTYGAGTLQITNVEELHISGGSAGDSVTGAVGNDVLNGNGGDDVLQGRDGDDTLNGGIGNDALNGGLGANILNGGEGNDHIASSSVDTIDGGAGDDYVLIDRATALVAFTFSASALASAGGVTLADGTIVKSIERFDIYTGNGVDVFTLDRPMIGPSMFDAGGGVDRLIADFSTATTAVTGGNGILAMDTGQLFSNFEEVHITGGSANDNLSAASGNARLFGGGGNDAIIDNIGNDVLSGDAGDDTLTSNFGSDSVDGGAGYDELLYGRDGETASIVINVTAMATNAGYTLANGSVLRNIEAYEIGTGSGNDEIILTSLADGHNNFRGGEGMDKITADLSAATEAISLFSASNGTLRLYNGGTLAFLSVEQFTITGGSGWDDLRGNAYEDVFNGNDGNDNLEGYAGNDMLSGGNDDDFLNGGSGINQLLGGAGNDQITSESAGDLVDGGVGNDRAVIDRRTVSQAFSLSDTQMQSAPGQTLADGTVVRNVELLYVFLGSGNDTVSLTTVPTLGQHNIIDEGGGTDTLIVDWSANAAPVRTEYYHMEVGGNVVLHFFAFEHVTITTGIGNDWFDGITAAQIINGGAGSDTVNYQNSTEGVRASLVAGAVGVGGFAQGDTLTNIEVLRGSQFDDVLIGNDANNTLWDHSYGGNDQLSGGGGNDFLMGSDGDDILEGGAGADVIEGEVGNDTALYSSSDAAVLVDLTTAHLQAAVGGHAEGDLLFLVENLVGSAFGDTLGGSSVANTLRGGGGGDTLRGLDGNDVLFGENGDDLLAGGTGADAVNGGDGIDTADYATSAAGVTLRLWSGAGLGGDAQGDVLTAVENLIGSAHNDVLIGAANANALNGGAGVDYLDGLDGDDTLAGEAGGDQMLGGAGSDTLSYATSNAAVTLRLWNNTATGGHATGDTFSGIENAIGSLHADFLIGSNIANTLRGAAGADYLDGLEANDALFGGDGDDTLIGGLGADALNGGAGIDGVSYAASDAAVTIRLWSGAGLGGHAQGDTLIDVEGATGSIHNDILIGSTLANTLRGGEGADYLDGMEGADALYGDGGVDQLRGGAGDDTLAGGGGADRLEGAAGIDTATYASSGAAVTVRLSTGAGLNGDAQGDVLVEVENLIGSAHADILIGSAGVNVLRGGEDADYLDGLAGDDQLFGDGGVDMLVGGAGADLLNGGAGIDTASYTTSSAAITVRLSTGAGLNGDAQGDTLVDIENVTGSNHADTLIGNAVANVLRSGDGADYLDGLAGNDQLFGDNGADMLVGGLGADTLIGGAGADAFIFNATLGGGNVDAITDFSVVDDVIRVDDAVFAGLAVGALAASAFVIGAAAKTAAHRIIYNSTTGALSFDADGNGAGVAIQFATLSTGLALTNADFYVI